ncbi:GNAT family N-acetyltransferase [Halovenus sp. WSH3]|uniref:GNAT family N-acetyltransferase n=1 Tax=Halovenus carboxidivorans TaxID=2692199 RepID=A0A6B0TGA0_9EURY|nr:GNAT family N-acetyltransferase [Halovenus carboxidivorans]MXR52209.1 GNAT family N-acetyltransferase [Halovenus carboxidivorans]
MADGIQFRRYDPRDSEAVLRLHAWAMREAGTDPTDVPGTEDLETIESSYIESGGEFLVGISESADSEVPRTFDGAVVAMGGFLPNEQGHDDERTVPGSVELHRMRVAPPSQGQGYGRALLAELERRVDTDSYDRLLATTARRQQRAVDLYSTAGYREVDRSVMGEYELVHFEKSLEG